jgi:hypothetical protein
MKTFPERTTLSDVGWYVGLSLIVGAAFALLCLLGIAARKTVHRRAQTPL